VLRVNRFDVRTLLDANAELPQRRQRMAARRFGPRLRYARLGYERDLQSRERFGDLRRQFDAGQTTADDRDASAVGCGLLQCSMNVVDSAELDCHRVFAHTYDAIHVDMRAEREYERIELEAVAAELEHTVAVIELIDVADVQLDAGSADEGEQAPVADALSRRALMQPNALDEAIRGTDERDRDVRGCTSRQTQGAADTPVARAGNDDAMWVHIRKTDGCDEL
jgi:hypothetical protein